MTPKEKAKKLVRKYWDLGGIDVLEAKQCALIAVDEIIETFPKQWNGFEYESRDEYWQEVKKELQNV